MKKGEKTVFKNEYGNVVDQFILSGKTKCFDDEVSAIEYAKQRNTYHYQIFVDGQTNGQYGVPS